jgi:enoyl-CoA hydratase / 3-hydroxyacyl-CoA dehydrogenase
MEPDDIETIAVLGAGNMGHGIAEVAAMAGYEVTLRDINEEFVQSGYDDIEWSLNKLADSGQLSEDESRVALDRVTPVVEMETAVSEADYVIEAVPERMDIKREVYDELEQHLPDRSVIASNTSSLSITDLSEATERPERFCGMHFFNPAVRMPLVEVITGAHTTDETLDLAETLAAEFGKTPVRVRKDSPGFIVNRVLVPLLNEAAWIVETDAATIATVDSTTKFEMGLPMGAFELADQVGNDVSLDVLQYLNETLGEAYEPCPLLERKVENDQLGKKAGEGFYDYENGGVSIPTDEQSEDIEHRLLAVMANEVAKLVGEEVAPANDVDQATVLGAGFPDGPAKLADEVGLATLHETLVDLHEETGAARYEPATYLEEHAGTGFYDSDEQSSTDFEAIGVEYPGDGVGKIVLDRPQRMNTVDPTMLDELAEAIDSLDGDEDVRALLVEGAGDRAFSAGADVQGMAASATPLDGIELSRKGQSTFGKLESCSMPVVAAIDGYCLGGGMELAACADLRVASERSTLGQPEVNLGLLPGWGGTQRLQHIVGMGRAKEIVLTGERYDPETLAEYGFINEVVGNETIGERARELAADLAGGPPIAQAFAKRAMLAGREDVESGLEIEAQSFGHLMATEDLLEGIDAFSSDRDPEFEGK